MYRSKEEREAGEKVAAATVRYMHFPNEKNLKLWKEALRELEKAQKKARTLAFHKEKALNGNQRSKDYLERERMREESMIFSRDERLKE